MPTFVFFSTDVNSLYKNDVYRCLSVPKGYSIRFRYQTHHLWNDGDEVLEGLSHSDKIRELKSRFAQMTDGRTKSLVFFGAQSDDGLQFHCVRSVLVRDWFYKDALDEFSFILTMDEFVDAAIEFAEDNSPPSTYIATVDTVSTTKSRWIDRVVAVRVHFQNTIFLYFEAVKDRNGKEIPCKYSSEKLQSHFNIREDATYTVSTLL